MTSLPSAQVRTRTPTHSHTHPHTHNTQTSKNTQTNNVGSVYPGLSGGCRRRPPHGRERGEKGEKGEQEASSSTDTWPLHGLPQRRWTPRRRASHRRTLEYASMAPSKSFADSAALPFAFHSRASVAMTNKEDLGPNGKL